MLIFVVGVIYGLLSQSSHFCPIISGFTSLLRHPYWLSRAGGNLAPVSLYFSLIFAVPVVSAQIPGFGLVNNLFNLSSVSFLSLVIFLPVSLVLASSNNSLPFGRLRADKLLASYLILLVALGFRDTTVTGGFRGVLVLYLGTFLPYYVVSRSLRSVQEFREAMLSLVVSIMILALIGIFESGKF